MKRHNLQRKSEECVQRILSEHSEVDSDAMTVELEDSDSWTTLSSHHEDQLAMA